MNELDLGWHFHMLIWCLSIWIKATTQSHEILKLKLKRYMLIWFFISMEVGRGKESNN
jgi:hypothetical protein